MKLNTANAERRVALLVVLLGAVWLNGSPATAKGAFALPDSRSYEQVSPVDKNGTDVEEVPTMAAVDGNRLLFVSRGSFAGQPTTLSAESSPYLSTRGLNGWITEGIALPNGQFSFASDGYQGFNPDMSKGLIDWGENTRFGTHNPLAQPGFNQYIRNSETGSFELANGTLSSMANDEGFVWGTMDFDMVALDSRYPLSPGSPCPGGVSGGPHCAYEVENGVVRLASVLPNEELVEGSVGNRPFICNFEHAVSDDGSRLFFTSLSGEHKLYARESGTSTTLVSGSERTLPGGASGNGVNYQSAEAAHGNKVLFTTKDSLVDADTNATNDLYMYDFTKQAGERLTLISEDQDPEAPGGAAVNGGGDINGACAGLVGASEDLRRVYFVADNQIVAGAPEGAEPKLYLWDDTGASPQITYIATLHTGGSPSSVDARVWAAPAVSVRQSGIPRQARWSRDGRYLAFISTASLTSFENEGEEEIYRYDAVSGSLDCLTCSSDALPAHGEVAFQSPRSFIRPVNHLPRNISDSGQVFFQTSRGLILLDSNGQRDVYEYDGGLHLISRGSGDAPSSFLDATPSGSDVFFTTRDRLVGWDKDANVDAYDARVRGGFPEPAFVPPACEGEACLPPPIAPNDPTPASSSFSGAGNVSSPKVSRCPAGKRRRHGECRKKKRARRQHSPPSRG